MRRGEIWRVSLAPSIGDEMRKTRPAVIVSADKVGILRLRVVVPITAWQPAFANWPWMVRIDHTAANGLTKDSAADALQVKSLSTARFAQKLGELPEADMDRIGTALDEVLDRS